MCDHGELDRGLADVVAHRAEVADVEREELLVAAGRVAQSAERTVDLDPREPGAREITRGTFAGHDRIAAFGRTLAAIDEWTIATTAGAYEHDEWIAGGRQRLLRDRQHEVRLLRALKDRCAVGVELPRPAVGVIRRR